MTKTHDSKHPIISSVLIALIPVVLLSVAGTAISIGNLGDIPGFVVQAIACAISVLLGFLIIRKTGVSLREIGFRKPEHGTSRVIFYYIPIIILALLIFIQGFSSQNTIARVLILLVFTILVGINEELFYRGIIIQRMQKIGIKKAILIASLLFGLFHAASLLGGYKSPLYVLLQVVFAFAFGIVAAEIAVITKSLLPVILWHFVHDFLTLITNQDLNTTAFIVLAIQVVILVVCAVLFWRKLILKYRQ